MRQFRRANRNSLHMMHAHDTTVIFIKLELSLSKRYKSSINFVNIRKLSYHAKKSWISNCLKKAGLKILLLYAMIYIWLKNLEITLKNIHSSLIVLKVTLKNMKMELIPSLASITSILSYDDVSQICAVSHPFIPSPVTQLWLSIDL